MSAQLEAASGPRAQLGRRLDLTIGAALWLVAVIAYLWTGDALHVQTFSTQFNLLFQADIPRVIGDFTDPHYNHYRTKVHPLYVLLLNPLGTPLAHLLGHLAAARLMTAAAGAGAVWLLFLCARRIGTERSLAAGLAVAYALASAQWLWSSAPESWAFGALSLTFLWYVALGAMLEGRRSGGLLGLAGAVVLGVTVTNFAQSLIAFAGSARAWAGSRPFAGVRQFTLLAGTTLAAVIALSGVQHWIYPSANLFFLPSAVREEQLYTQIGDETLRQVIDGRATPQPRLVPKLLGQAGESAANLLLYGAVAPAPKTAPIPGGGVGLAFRSDSIARYAVWQWLGLLLLWGGAVAGGVALWRRRRSVCVALAAALGFNWLLHTFYGVEDSFLYSPHVLFVPYLLIAAACARWGGRARSGIWAALLVLILIEAASDHRLAGAIVAFGTALR